MKPDNEKIAVVGLAGRFPGADNLNEFWNNLINGKETIHYFSDEELVKYELDYEELKNNPSYVKARGILNDIDKFDTSFFGYSPKEAALTDPQHRLWLETAWEAFEDAGCDPYTSKYSIGVFAGGFVNTYLLNNILRDSTKLENYIRFRSTESFQLLTGNDISCLPTKTAYKFNLRGPAINVQTACSTSLVAIAQACHSLYNNESDICIAGGVCILTPQESGYIYQEGAIPSPDGHCRPFDEKGKGTVFSNGIGIVVLKRLEDAVHDHDRIYATVNGWALNNDGNNKVSYTAPSINGQSEVILMAQQSAEITPDEIGYIETHGTATPLGDLIEMAALTKAFSTGSDHKQFCGIGSLKSNIGHTDAAAGVASFIKACLCIHHKTIPPSLNFTKPNPYINFQDSPFYVVNHLRKWDSDIPLYIGVSSFGIGGTNAHVIIAEPPVHKPSEHASSVPQLVVLSAKTENALAERKKQLISFLQNNPDIKLSDLVFTLQNGRNHMEYRSCMAVSSLNDVSAHSDDFYSSRSEDNFHSLAFAFPGQGSQFTGMGKQLYESSQLFRSLLDQCFKIFLKETGENLKDIIFRDDSSEAENKLAQTKYTQPALFIIEYALARLYISLGYESSFLIGHSIGEYTAACLSGVFDLESAFRIVMKRGSLMQDVPSGKMMAVNLSKEKLQEINEGIFEISAWNAPEMCTISFPDKNLDQIKILLDHQEISYSLLNTSHAFHSEAFDPVLQEFENYVNRFNLKQPLIPFISCLTGSLITKEEACTGKYWANQLRNTVQFSKGISFLASKGKLFFLEVGPNTHLSSLIRRNDDVKNKSMIIKSLGKKTNDKNELTRIYQSIGELWANGYPMDFDRIRAQNSGNIISLPPYPWQRQHCWIEYLPAKKDQLFKTGIREEIVVPPVHAPSSDLTGPIRKLLSEMSGFPVQRLDENTRFVDFGFDSLFLAQFARELEKKYKSKILFRELAHNYDNIKKLSRFIESDTTRNKQIFSTKNFRNLGFLNKDGHNTPLILVHGSNSVHFLTKHFNGERPILNYFDLGSDGEKILSKNIDEMAMEYIDQLMELAPEGPYVFCGFSFGGLLAYKMAEILHQKGNHKVAGIVLFDTKTPQTKLPGKIYKVLHVVKGNKILFLFQAFTRRIKKLKLYKVYFLLNKPLPVKFRSRYIESTYEKLSAGYLPNELNTKILLFRSCENLAYDKLLGWGKLVKDIEHIELEGNHSNILYLEQNYKIISDKISHFINENHL